MHTDAIAWNGTAVRLLDQTKLPAETTWVDIDSIEAMVEAIKLLRVRGAPLIGIAAAMGLAAAVDRARRRDELGAGGDGVLPWIEGAGRELVAARPTAVNLEWAVTRCLRAVRAALTDVPAPAAAVTAATVLRDEAQAIWDEDAAMCLAIGRAGADRLPMAANVLTVCNTGMLATGGIGTAFGVIREGAQQGRVSHVYACETRPLRQGARLTAWELARTGIAGSVIVDGAAAMLMAQGKVDVVIAGADRIAANGDAANKIGTYSLATLAAAHGIPFYIAAPKSTIDLGAPTGADIPIEERGRDEIGVPDGVAVYNPAFDVTPARLITGIVTDAGLLTAPYDRSVADLFEGAPAA